MPGAPEKLGETKAKGRSPTVKSSGAERKAQLSELRTKRHRTFGICAGKKSGTQEMHRYCVNSHR